MDILQEITLDSRVTEYWHEDSFHLDALDVTQAVCLRLYFGYDSPEWKKHTPLILGFSSTENFEYRTLTAAICITNDGFSLSFNAAYRLMRNLCLNPLLSSDIHFSIIDFSALLCYNNSKQTAPAFLFAGAEKKGRNNYEQAPDC